VCDPLPPSHVAADLFLPPAAAVLEGGVQWEEPPRKTIDVLSSMLAWILALLCIAKWRKQLLTLFQKRHLCYC